VDADGSRNGVRPDVVEGAPMRRSPALDAMVRAAEKAARRLQADFARAGEVTVREKGPADFVSSADLASQDILERELGDAFPDHELVLEENGEPRRGAAQHPRLLVDPLDGTTNFVHGIPHFSVAIGLDGPAGVTAGVVLNAGTGELFFAERGAGSWVGGASPRRLHVSKALALADAVVGTGIPNRGGKDHAGYLAALAGVMEEAAGIRRLGSAALDLAYVAAGRFEAFFERGLSPWDVAAGSLLVTEAGGVVSRSNGTPGTLEDGDILAACNPAMRDAMVARIGRLSAKAGDLAV
jgi:myo-inositol-1(or 4)-monophosphatase